MILLEVIGKFIDGCKVFAATRAEALMRQALRV